MNIQTNQTPTVSFEVRPSTPPASASLPAGAELEARDLLPPLPARRGVNPLARDRASLLGRRAMYLPV